jgi:hypothetical protein
LIWPVEAASRDRLAERGFGLEVLTDIGQARPGHGADPRELERVLVGELLGRAEPRSSADVIAAEHLDVAELAVGRGGDRALPGSLGCGDAPMERGGALLVPAPRRVHERGSERELGGGLELRLTGPPGAGDGVQAPIGLDRSGAHGSPDSRSA